MTSAAPRSGWSEHWQKEKAPPRRQPLSRERIVEAALRIVDAEGMDALSMRRVGQELGTGAASLYAHVGSKEELVELVLDLAYTEIELERPDPATWQEQVKRLLRRSRQVLLSHRDLARAAVVANVPVTPHAMDIAEAMLGMLRAGGLDEQTAAYGVDLLGLYTTATAFEASTRGGGNSEEFTERIRNYFDTVPTDRYPMITSMAVALTRDVGDERFEFGLDILVAGLARQSGTAG
ncbi:TetR/AcrR family transcriptional regulator [Kitasatospora sp. NPDC058201]|uniref:TetR/AcrR family transcriptional regulator n=1 Tax=Streptomycetaceae TaxID=2062 RepID=UPI002E77BFF0|nr:TetR/AcrR family transcriptional regulator [Streptomyces sp. BE303]MED7952651.1 TetR/AcrR family transcriptional regulator [Streptomyces sp. BE303]